MALLTIPTQPLAKNVDHEILLDKTSLFAIGAVSVDEYFAVAANVKTCIVEFNSDPGNQKEVLSFDLSQASPMANFRVSLRARSSFLLERLILEDFDGGTLILSRSQLPGGLDITIAI